MNEGSLITRGTENKTSAYIFCCLFVYTQNQTKIKITSYMSLEGISVLLAHTDG